MTGFLDLAGASRFLSRSPRWVRGNPSLLPHFRVHSQILFRADELLKAMERFRAPVQHVDLDVVMRRAGIQPCKRSAKAREAAG